MPSLGTLLSPLKAIAWIVRKVRDSILQQHAHKETAYKERIAIWRSRVEDARTDEETEAARQGLHQAQNEYMLYLDDAVLQLAKEVVQDRASAGPITADAPKLPPADREGLASAASVVARLEPPTTFEEHFLQGNAFHATEQFDKALEQYSRALELRSDHPDTLNYRAITLRNLERYDEALADYNRALDLRPDDPGFLINRGVTLDYLQRYDEALADYGRALELRPDHPLTLSNRGVTFINVRRYEEAVADLDRALELEPGYESALFNRACAYSQMARFKQSLHDLKEAISRDEKNRKDAREDEDFANLRSDPTLGPEFERLVAEPED